jgi:molybdate ABC transporter permease protein
VLSRGRFRGRTVLRAVVVLPVVMPPVVAGVGMLAAFGRRGIVGAFLYEHLGIQVTFTTWAAILAATFVSLPLAVLALEAGLRSLDERLEGAASTLGASRWYVIRRVTLPMLSPQIAAALVLAWARALGEFGATITFAGNLQGRTQTLPLAVFERLQTDQGAAFALSVLLIAIALAVDVTVRRDTFAATIAFTATPGETIALLGPNGSGKTTLVAAVAGLMAVERGRIAMDAEVLEDTGLGVHVPPERRPVGVVFQDLLLFPHLSALENVAFPLRARGIARAAARARATALLDRLGVGDRAAARPRALSGGQAQRVALARALAAEPSLLLLDEPLSALDAGARPAIRDLLRDELSRFRGVRLLVTHDPVEARVLADRLVLIEDGRVTQVGTPDEVRDAPRSRYAADLVGVNAFRGRLERSDTGTGVIKGDDGAVVVPWPSGFGGGEVVAVVRPSDVTVSLGPPSGSARNILRGRVRAIEPEGERARIRIASSPPIVAEITAGSVERLDLREGIEVWASFKAVEVEVLS